MGTIIIAQKVSQEVTKILQQAGETVTIQEGNLEQLKAELPRASAILLGTWVKFNEELIQLAPELLVISRTGVGVDNVDVDAATRRGILVLNTPEANAISVAEHTIALICGLSKYLVYLHGNVVKGNFQARREYLPVDLDGKTLGLLGFGNIGRKVAKKAMAAFDMKVLAYDPFVTETSEPVTLCSQVDELLAASDIVSIHMPLLPSTKNLIGRKELQGMKPSSFLINTSRGGIIDEDALAEALENGWIAGAALDVFAQEPPDSGHRLLQSEKVILTPHSAALTQECTVRVAIAAAEGIADLLAGREPKFIYNKKQLSARTE